jgi:serine/threonine protein kinase
MPLAVMKPTSGSRLLYLLLSACENGYLLIGCVLYEIETGRVPYSSVTPRSNSNSNSNSNSHNNDQSMIERITGDECLRPLLVDDNKGIDDPLAQFIRQLWATNPSNRPTAHQVVIR